MKGFGCAVWMVAHAILLCSCESQFVNSLNDYNHYERMDTPEESRYDSSRPDRLSGLTGERVVGGIWYGPYYCRNARDQNGYIYIDSVPHGYGKLQLEGEARINMAGKWEMSGGTMLSGNFVHGECTEGYHEWSDGSYIAFKKENSCLVGRVNVGGKYIEGTFKIPEKNYGFIKCGSGRVWADQHAMTVVDREINPTGCGLVLDAIMYPIEILLAPP